MREAPLADLEDLRVAFQEVLGYHTAYRVHGAEAGPDLGWAIRNFNDVAELLREVWETSNQDTERP